MARFIDEQAFLQAFDELADPLFRHCYFRLFDREKAKDAVQETFVRAWKTIAAGTRIKHLKAFLYQTARRIVIDEQRKAKHRQHPSLDELKESGQEPSHTPTQALHEQIDVQRLFDLAQSLPDDYREVLFMRYAEGLEPAEIAAINQETNTTVSVRINRAVKKLRDLIPGYE